MNDALAALQANYFYLTDNLDDLLDLCPSDAEKRDLKGTYQQATVDYYDARNKAFADDDASIADTVSQLRTVQDSLEKMSIELANAVSIINNITTAVRIGTELAAMAK
jgi:flagellar hook-basal body complex protein FliE